MRDKIEEMSPEPEQHQAINSQNDANESQTPSRRELIERYAKYAVIGAPLLLFVSKAQAIHSKP